MNQSFKSQNSELKQKIKQFEAEHGDLREYILNENLPYLHSMKIRGEIFDSLDIDTEFENADLLDFLGYERIIACNKNKK